jgi:GTPase Era involved in 16S rRNA processing
VVLFETNQGALWDREKTVSEMLLDTDLVVIFFDTSDWCEEYHVTKDTLINHFDALDKHFVLAKKLNKSFKEIPWIFVLNKIDLDLREPFSKYLKEYGDFKVHQISVLKDIGITSLIDEIVKKLKNY